MKQTVDLFKAGISTFLYLLTSSQLTVSNYVQKVIEMFSAIYEKKIGLRRNNKVI